MGKLKVNKIPGSKKIQNIQWFMDDGTRFTISPDDFHDNALRIHKFSDDSVKSSIHIIPEVSNTIIIK